MRRLRNLVCVLLFLTIPVAALPQVPSNTVTAAGTVFADGKNERLEHVEVQLCDAGGTVIRQTTTSDSGEFYFRGIERGRYILRFQANGFQNSEVHLDLSFMSDRGVTVYLKHETKDSGNAGSASVSAHELSMPQTAQDLVSAGRRKLSTDKDAQGAIGDFAKAVATAPGYYEAYYEMGMANVTLGQRDEAMKNFKKSIEVSHDNYGDADVGLGTILIEGSEVDNGEKFIRRGVALNSNSWIGFYELGKLDLNRNRLDSAQDSAERARTLAPNTPIVYRLLANIHLRQKHYTDLLGDLDKYISLDPDSPAGVRAKEMRRQVKEEVAKLGQQSNNKKTN